LVVHLATGGRRDLGVVEQRPDGGDPVRRGDARVGRHLIQPIVTRVLGVTARTDDEGRDDARYRGEESALVGSTYRVNRLAIQHQELAVVRRRQAEDSSGSRAFDQP
jgi:hypothetical protein